MKFEIKKRDAAGRICKFNTKHGTISTPNLMPVINPNKMLITPKEMKKLFGTEIIITNSYIIYKDSDLRKKALKDGLHKLINFDGPIMTDSGTFQSYVYKNIDLDPSQIVLFQKNIGSDIGTILDVFGTPDQTQKEAEIGVKETLKRAKKSMKLKGDMMLACTVQGSTHPKIRTRCAKELSKIDADFFPIGGVVPIMENQRYADLVKIIISSKKGLDHSKPVHLFGAGHPLIFPLAVALGCDFFDSSAYAKYANDGRMLFPWGTESLYDLDELPCSCPICSKYNANDLKKIEKSEMILNIAKHNLYVSFAEIKKIKAAIANGNLWELVERRANSNPHLLESLKELRNKESKDWLEQFESISKNKALFYTGNHTIHRPIIHRCHNRLLNRYKAHFKNYMIFLDGKKPYSSYYSKKIKKISEEKIGVNVVINSRLGPVPIELDEMYPFAQSVFPNIIDKETEEEIARVFKEFTKNKKIIFWEGIGKLKELKKEGRESYDLDRLKISAVSDMQFYQGSSNALFNGNIKIVKSKKTGKIRNIYCNDKHILSMRAGDGLFTLKIDGARLLHEYFKYPKLRVIINKNAVPFVEDGKSVFAKFVSDCDPGLRPFDECLIVSEEDKLIAVGRCLMNRSEMLSFNCGIAVKTRENI
ncbi:MAG: tRNA guanosine(15) transglycosylase TgtA [Thermoplasmatales archaeon]|nr:MAG: tRNA guanosine(15) transglycosylase TgtA [Thermoplasmatales archaeon]